MIQSCIDFVPSTTNTEDVLILDDIKVMPNPASDFMKINYTLERNTDLDIFVTDATGRVVSRISSGKHFTGTNEINWTGVSELADGIYFMEFVGEGFLRTKVFVK